MGKVGCSRETLGNKGPNGEITFTAERVSFTVMIYHKIGDHQLPT
jgi:hypothetical protein